MSGKKSPFRAFLCFPCGCAPSRVLLSLASQICRACILKVGVGRICLFSDLLGYNESQTFSSWPSCPQPTRALTAHSVPNSPHRTVPCSPAVLGQVPQFLQCDTSCSSCAAGLNGTEMCFHCGFFVGRAAVPTCIQAQSPCKSRVLPQLLF